MSAPRSAAGAVQVPWSPTDADVLLYNATCQWAYHLGDGFAHRIARMSVRQIVAARGEPVPLRILVAGDHRRAA